jgi:hypothetical protein
MTIPKSPSGSANWQVLYSQTENHWLDLKRIGGFIIPIILLLVISTASAIGYIVISINDWDATTDNLFLYYMLLIRIVITILVPIAMAFVGLRFVFKQAGEFIVSVYEPDADEKLNPLIRRKLFGVPPAPPPLNNFINYPFILVTEPKLKEKNWARWFGGPGILVIYDGIAVYLERGNKFSRIVGPGLPMPFLERHERIKDVVDLRPQTKIDDIRPWTKDGIRITLTIRAEIQIDPGAEVLKKSSKLRYPFNPVAVKKAVEYSSVKVNNGKLEEQSWIEGAWGTITGAVNRFVAGHSIDELFLAPQTEDHPDQNNQENHTAENIEQILSLRISKQVIDDIQASLQRNGIRILDLQITKVEIREEVRALWTKYWESIKQKTSAQRNSRAEAERIRARELAHAEAQRTMLMTITKRLENIDPADLTEPLILSLSGILDQGLDDPIVRPLIAKEAFAVLDRMRKLIHERF